jgi:membrane-associated phospholipid phosphatase
VKFPLFLNVLKNIIKILSWRHIVYILIGICLTVVCVFSGIDNAYYYYFYKGKVYNLLFPAVFLGGIIPIILPMALYTSYFFERRREMKVSAFALAQAAILGSFLSSTMKAFTGRVPPPNFVLNSFSDLSHSFRFGFMEGGIFWGWPSSHTTIAFAMAITLVTLYPKNLYIRTLSIFYAFYIGLGVSMSIHWFSDFLMGAILGSVIGVVVGNSFRRESKFF